MEETADPAEVGCRGEEIGIEVEAVGEVRMCETTTLETTEGVGTLGAANLSTRTPRHLHMVGTLPLVRDKGTHGVVTNKEQKGPTVARIDRTPPSPEVPSLPFPLTRSAKFVALTTMSHHECPQLKEEGTST